MIEEMYKKKTIRDFLSLFSEFKWKEIIFLLVEYAILTLKVDKNVASLSLDDLSCIVDEMKEEAKKKEKKMKRKLEEDLRSKNTRQLSKSKYNLKPPSNWRKGDEMVYNPTLEDKEKKLTKQEMVEKIIRQTKSNSKQDSNGIIYPKWWGNNHKKTYYTRKNNSGLSENPRLPESKNDRSRVSRRVSTGSAVSRGNRSNSKKLTSNTFVDRTKVVQAESKIKNQVETDKRIFNLIKQRKDQRKKANNTGTREDYSRYLDDPSNSREVEENNFADSELMTYTQTNGYPRQPSHLAENSYVDPDISYMTKQEEPNSVYYNQPDSRQLATYKHLNNSEYSSYPNQHSKLQHNSRRESKQNFLIEYDKNLKPQNIHRKESNNESFAAKTYKGESFQNPDSRSNLGSFPYHTRLDSNYSNKLQTSNSRVEETFVKEQNYLNYNKNFDSGFSYKMDSSHLSSERGGNNSYAQNHEQNINATKRSREVSERNHYDVLSPHFNDGERIKFHRQRDSKDSSMIDNNDIHYYSKIEKEYDPHSKEDVQYQFRENRLGEESCSLSSYAPSEKTKAIYQKNSVRNQPIHKNQTRQDNLNETENSILKYSNLKEDYMNGSFKDDSSREYNESFKNAMTESNDFETLGPKNQKKYK